MEDIATTIRLPADLKERLNETAAAKDLRLAQAIRRAISEWCDRNSAGVPA